MGATVLVMSVGVVVVEMFMTVAMIVIMLMAAMTADSHASGAESASAFFAHKVNSGLTTKHTNSPR